MGVLKDKLANSVRQAKAAAHPSEGQPRAAARARPAPAATVVAPAPVQPGHRSSADPQDPLPSAKEMFPRRVWPD